jgi:hypothetical protein
MGLDLTYDADGTTFTRRFSPADWDTIDVLTKHLPKEIGICFDVPAFGEPVRIKTEALREAARSLDSFLAENAHLLPAMYQFKLERFPVPGVPPGGFETGGISGLRLPGDTVHFYAITSGLNVCELQKMGIGADGNGAILEKRDLRAQTELMTENAGLVKFRRRAAKTSLRRSLREIAAFADTVTCMELMKIVG